MLLHEYPTVNRHLKDVSLREQMESRLRQISGGYYTDTAIAKMSDYGLLTAFEVTILGIGHNSADLESSEAFDAGVKFGQERMLNTINGTFTMKEGNLIASSRDIE